MSSRVRRPNAEDRKLADVFRKLAVGEYKVTVEMPSSSIAFMSLARVKCEGAFDIEMPDGKLIGIIPVGVK